MAEEWVAPPAARQCLPHTPARQARQRARLRGSARAVVAMKGGAPRGVHEAPPLLRRCV